MVISQISAKDIVVILHDGRDKLGGVCCGARLFGFLPVRLKLRCDKGQWSGVSDLFKFNE